jgi:deoxycytidylate deaminase
MRISNKLYSDILSTVYGEGIGRASFYTLKYDQEWIRIANVIAQTVYMTGCNKRGVAAGVIAVLPSGKPVLNRVAVSGPATGECTWIQGTSEGKCTSCVHAEIRLSLSTQDQKNVVVITRVPCENCQLEIEICGVQNVWII